MSRGGARVRSGPAPDPNALRRDRKDDSATWVTLPAEGRKGRTPEWPLGEAEKSELALWRTLWKRPQAVMWEKLHLQFQVAAYVRAFLESVQPAAPASTKSVVVRMQEDLGLSVSGLTRHRWRIAYDEISEHKQNQQNQKPVIDNTDVRTRLKAVK
ncbi:hypothetical protein [Canibacter oris]|uniref:Uncharacterized protein n=1 Tax=Canibacter oris TaxID=1365628 RepID=A0A840DPY2_9MICO|nr:hypothetical protein [Canibacter oris]MBB4072058.1 hypothetical protein [Canibacter oris]